MSVLVFDLDDTLLRRDKQINESNLRALYACLDRGYKIVIATSRPMRAIRQFLPDRLLVSTSIISLNGAVVHFNGERSTLSNLADSSREIVSTAMQIDNAIVSIEFYGDKFGTNKDFTDQELWDYQNATKHMMIPMDALDYTKVCKIAIDGCGNDLLAFKSSINRPSIKIIPAMNNTFLNILAAGVDKSSSLKYLCALLNVKLEELIVFGDDTPDVEMMSMAGISVAMGNANASVKATADFVIGDCDSNAIAEFLSTRIQFK